jgi:hypothetical protein
MLPLYAFFQIPGGGGNLGSTAGMKHDAFLTSNWKYEFK